MTDHTQIGTQASEPETLSHADTQFVLHTPAEQDVRTVDSNIPMHLSDPLDLYVSQDYPVYSYTWTSANAKNDVIYNARPINQFINAPAVRDRLINRKGMKGTFEVTVKLNSPGGARGALLVELYPLAFTNPRATWVDMHSYTQYQLTHTAVFDASCPQDIVFKLSPHHIEPFMNLTPNGGKHWRMKVTVIGPLTNTMNATAIGASMRIYVRALEHQFVGLVPEMKVSSMLKNMSKTIEEKGTPYFGKVATAAASVTRAAGDVADLFGFSKPINNDVIVTYPASNRVMTVDSPDTAEVVSLFTYNRVSPISREDEDEDPLSIASITNHETLVYRGAFTYDNYIRIPICPGNYPTNATGPTGMIQTCDMYCLLPFKQYRVEQFIYTLRIFSAPNVRGDLYVYFLPNVDLTDVYNNTWESHTKKMTISFQGSSCTEITVNWNANCRTIPMLPLTTNSGTPTDMETPSNGMLVLLPGYITSPNGAISVDFDLTYKSRGLQGMDLSEHRYNDNNNSWGRVSLPSAVITEAAVLSDLSICTKETINQSSEYDIYAELSGDPIKSLRALAQRPSLQADLLILWDATGTNATIGAKYFDRTFTPLNSVTAIAKSDGTATTTLVQHMSYAAWAVMPFLGYKSSSRHSIKSVPSVMLIRNASDPLVVATCSIWKPRIYPIMSNQMSGDAQVRTFLDGGFLQQYETLSTEENPRVVWPYNQPYAYLPSCWSADGAAVEFDYFGEKKWAVCKLDLSNPYPTTIGGLAMQTQIRYSIWSSAGDDLSVFMWRGIPQWTFPA